MMNPRPLLALLIAAFLPGIAIGAEPTPKEEREKAQRLQSQGNWKESLEIRKLLLESVNDAQSPFDLEAALRCQLRLRRMSEFDATIESAIESHAENWPLLHLAAKKYFSANSWGYLVDGEFRRGNHRGGGQYITVRERDRVKSINLALRAIAVAEEQKVDPNQIAVLWHDLAGMVQNGRQGRYHVWALSVLTPLNELPDYGVNSQLSSGAGAPVDEKGDMLEIAVPESWRLARNDGERWRFALAEAVRLNANWKPNVDYAWANFLVTHYDVGTMAQYGWWQQIDPEQSKGILQIHTLKENETVAALAGGVKRFSLPIDYQFIPLLRDISERGNSGIYASAGDKLVQVFLDRRQYAQAALELKKVIAQHGAGSDRHRRKLLAQIVGDWGRFEPAAMFQAGSPVEVDFVYRNAKEVSLRLHRLKLNEVVQDIFDHLESNPRTLNHHTLHVGSVGHRLIQENQKKYLGEELRNWKVALEPRKGHWDTRVEVDLPAKEAGAYLLEAKAGDGNSSWIVVWVTDTALLTQQTKDGKLFYLAESKAGKPLTGEVEFFGYRVDHRQGAKRVLKKFDVHTVRFKRKANDGGSILLKRGDLKDQHQWMAVGRSENGGLALLGFQYHHWRDHRWDNYTNRRAYGITDRPVYRPEQEVHFKFWARTARYDLGEVSEFAGRPCIIEIHHQTEGKIHTAKNLRTDEFGGVEFEFDLPADAKLGQYWAHLKGALPNGSIGFRVEEYKKPEFEVLVEAPEVPVALGEVIKAKVSARYYHGAPVTNAQVKVKVQRYSHSQSWFPTSRWDWLYGRGYWWFCQDYHWYPGWEKWGCRAPIPWWYRQHRWTPPELVMEREFSIRQDGTVSVEIDTSIAKLVHGDMDHRYEISAEVVDSSRRTIYGKGSVLAARRPYSTTVWLDKGYARPGDTLEASFAAKTLDGRAVSVEGKATLYRLRLDDAGKVREERVKEFALAAEEDGEGRWKFEAPGSGQYRLAVSLKDQKGRIQEGATVFTVRLVNEKGQENRFNPLELILDKKEYRAGEEARLLINTNQPNSTVLLFLRTDGHTAGSHQLISIEGKSKEIAIKLSKADMPNVFVEAVTLVDGHVVTETKQIVLPPEKRILNVEVVPEKSKYKPREKGKLTLRLRDENGEPYRGTTVVTVYDKSLEYISGGSNVTNIRDFFWNWKRYYGYSSLRHSQQLQGHNLSRKKAILMRTLGRFGGNLVDMDEGAGALANGFGKLRNRAAGQPMAAKAKNEKSPAESPDSALESGEGGGGDSGPKVIVRSEFADLVKWAGSVTTDERGEATIEVDYPDNLTTWKVKTWALGHGTRVGEGSAEVITSKDLIVRLQAPRFFVESDEVVLSAIVHNYHETAREVDVSLELDGGTLIALGGTASRIAIPAGGEQRVDWKTRAIGEGEVTVRMKAISSDDGDAMEMTFPVYVHGMERTDSYSRAISPEGTRTEIEFSIPAKRRPEQTRLEIRYSPTVAGAMVDALPYLVNYPYGCTEQTLNRFVPTVITQRLLQDMNVNLQEVKNKRGNLNPQEIGDAKVRAAQWKHWKENPVWDKDEVDNMVREGIKRLREMQNRDGGWGWFSAYGERSYPHTTAIVVHGLIVAKTNGATIPEDMLKRGIAWLKRHEIQQAERIRMWGKRKRNVRKHANAQDALTRRTLGEGGVDHAEMLGFLFRDKVDLPVYGKCLLGLELHRVKDEEKRDAVVRNIEQFLKVDDENQTAWLELGNDGYWWWWYGSEFEAHAWYLKLLAATKPKSPQASGVAKYLVNNRKHATYWRSTRDTAYCIEAIADYLRASEEDTPEMDVEVVLDGKVIKTVRITADNLFSFDGTAVVAGDILGTGKHKVELRKKGKGPLYANVYVTVFSKEDFLRKAGLEVKVEREIYKLIPVKASQDVAGSRGQALKQRREKYERKKLAVGDSVESGDLIEVELSIESKNDYSYLLFEDWKAAGFEPVGVRSGYNTAGGLGAFMELRDEKVAFFVRRVPRGRHNISYRLRAETPGKFSVLPTRAEGMYAPELRGNSDEMKVVVQDRP